MNLFLMVMVEVYKSLRPCTLPPLTQVGVVDFRIALLLLVVFTKAFMVMREVDICLIPATTVTTTVVD